MNLEKAKWQSADKTLMDKIQLQLKENIDQHHNLEVEQAFRSEDYSRFRIETWLKSKMQKANL